MSRACTKCCLSCSEHLQRAQAPHLVPAGTLERHAGEVPEPRIAGAFQRSQRGCCRCEPWPSNTDMSGPRIHTCSSNPCASGQRQGLTSDRALAIRLVEGCCGQDQDGCVDKEGSNEGDAGVPGTKLDGHALARGVAGVCPGLHSSTAQSSTDQRWRPRFSRWGGLSI